MPWITPAQMARVETTLHRANHHVNRFKAKAAEKKDKAIEAAEIVGGGLAVGFVRGKMEAADGSWLIPGTTLDIELAAGAALVAAGFFGLAEDYSNDATNLGAGILAHYMGQAGRNYAKTGALAWPLVAGRGSNPILGASVIGASDQDLAQALQALNAR